LKNKKNQWALESLMGLHCHHTRSKKASELYFLLTTGSNILNYRSEQVWQFLFQREEYCTSSFRFCVLCSGEFLKNYTCPLIEDLHLKFSQANL